MALEHITVLDLTHMLSGPYGTMLLTDMGARTIKVEPPGTGEGTRRLLEKDPDHSREGMGAYFSPSTATSRASASTSRARRGALSFSI